MKLSMIGTGYIGLITGTCFAEVGNDVMCLDIDEAKIRKLRRGVIPIFEPGLADMVARNVATGRLRFTSDVDESVAFGDLQFIAVGTPPDVDGFADLQQVLAAASAIGARMQARKVVVNKSTVPIGTADMVRATITGELNRRGANIPFSVVSNPEFLKAGTATKDFMKPDRIIVGADDEEPIAIMRALYAPFQGDYERLIMMDVRSAELTKYAANAMLATRISFMNELALLAEKLGADIGKVRQGIGSDPRIGYQFLYSGCGYGGSCFPKDVMALQRIGKKNHIQLRVLSAVHEANEWQKRVLAQKMIARFGADLSGHQFAIWGLAFKPNTDDTREAPSLVIIRELTQRGATVLAYDPVAMDHAQYALHQQSGVFFAESAMAALKNSDALVIITEWEEFRSPNFAAMKAILRNAVIFDGRNIYDSSFVQKQGFEYYGIGCA
jgi:UDPglucose 6-dehydrogenase